MSQASEAKLNLRNQERRLLESYLVRPLSEDIGPSIAEAVRKVSNREAFKFVNIDWTALGAALFEEWPRVEQTPCAYCPHWMEIHNPDGSCGCGASHPVRRETF